MELSHFKWDAQIGDVTTLTPYPLLIAPATWSELANLAEALTRETLGMECELNPYRERFVSTDTAVVVDLPGQSSAETGIALAILGYRPIPLYNAIPGPRAVVNLTLVMDVLVDGANTVGGVPLSAPPAFLLDSNRLGRSALILEGSFDNRSICRPSDFPSAATMKRAGIRRAVVVTTTTTSDDLEDTLLDWQTEGIELWLKRTSDDLPATRVALKAPNVLKRVFRSIRRQLLPLRPDGSFGEFIGPSSG